jgi:hypothetical protein
MKTLCLLAAICLLGCATTTKIVYRDDCACAIKEKERALIAARRDSLLVVYRENLNMINQADDYNFKSFANDVVNEEYETNDFFRCIKHGRKLYAANCFELSYQLDSLECLLRDK